MSIKNLFIMNLNIKNVIFILYFIIFYNLLYRRLDYFLVSEQIKDNVCDNVIRDEVYGSDHCPIVLYINI